MSWTYFLDGKLASRSDQGVPAGKAVALVDNSDSQNVTTTGTWTATSTGTGYQGFNYQTHAAGSGSDSFTWRVLVPQDGTYEVFVRYTGANATTATYSVKHHTGNASTTLDQTKQQGQWVSLGKFGFAADDLGQQVSLATSASGTVAADAVKLVRDNTGEPNDQTKDFLYHYDATGNPTTIEDHTPGTKIDAYVVTYDGVNRAKTIQEKLAGVLKHTTAYPSTTRTPTRCR